MTKTVVQKYGGSSVAGADRLRLVARKVAARKASGARLVVVVSAMGDTTDELLALARGVSGDPPRRELDMLLSCGERISMALLSMALAELDVPAISFTGSQSGIITDENHARARIIEVRPGRILEALEHGKVVIVAGYQGVSRAKEVTTLGRGGSDTTAVALAAALGGECEIYSDVDGVFTADPRHIPAASRLDALSYDEMQALAVSGARVLNAEAVQFAKDRGITIHALPAHQAGEGTRVSGVPSGRAMVGVSAEPRAWLVEAPASVASVVAFLGGQGVEARLVAGGEAGGWAIVGVDDVHRDLTSVAPPGVRVRSDVGTVTCVGPGALRPRTVQAALEVAGTGALHVWASPLQLTWVVRDDEVSRLAAALHAALVAG